MFLYFKDKIVIQSLPQDRVTDHPGRSRNNDTWHPELVPSITPYHKISQLNTAILNIILHCQCLAVVNPKVWWSFFESIFLLYFLFPCWLISFTELFMCVMLMLFYLLRNEKKPIKVTHRHKNLCGNLYFIFNLPFFRWSFPCYCVCINVTFLAAGY